MAIKTREVPLFTQLYTTCPPARRVMSHIVRVCQRIDLDANQVLVPAELHVPAFRRHQRLSCVRRRRLDGVMPASTAYSNSFPLLYSHD